MALTAYYRICSSNLLTQSIFAMSMHHEISVEMRFIRKGEEKLVLVRNYPATAGETVDDVTKCFAVALGGEAVVLETKSVLIFDADFGDDEFAEAESSEDIGSVQRMQVTFDMHGSDEDCERLLGAAQTTEAIAKKLQVNVSSKGCIRFRWFG